MSVRRDRTTTRQDDTRATKQDCTWKQSADGAHCRCYARQREYEIRTGNAVVRDAASPASGCLKIRLELVRSLFPSRFRFRSSATALSLSISLSLSLPFSVSLSISPSMNLLGVVSRLSLPLTRRSNSGLVSPPSRRSSSSPAYFHPQECTHAYLEVRGCLSRQIPKPLTDVFRGKHSRPLRATS